MARNYLVFCLLGISTCFVLNTVARESILNGYHAPAGRFPSQIAILHENNNFCGGGIIGRQFILTAAHCVINEDGTFYGVKMPILAGTNDLHRRTPPAVIAEMHKIYVPREYNTTRFTTPGDIAVIKLKHPLPLSHDIQALELPMPRETFTGKRGTVAGFGVHWLQQNNHAREGGQNDFILRYADVDILDDFPVGPMRIPVPVGRIHAKVVQSEQHPPRGVCHGDSGGPLIHGKTIVGILNKAPLSCVEIDAGGIYAAVSHYVGFIHRAIADSREGMKYYEFNN